MGGCSSKPSDGEASGLPASTEFELKEQRSLILRTGMVRLPAAEYIFEAPPALRRKRLEGTIVGDGGFRLGLMTESDEVGRLHFVRFGWRKAPLNPKLIVRADGKVIFEKSVPALNQPMRAIPLVVPLEENAVLRPTSQSSLKLGPGESGSGLAFAIPPALRDVDIFTVDHTEWAAEPNGDFQYRGRKNDTVTFRLLETDHGGFADITAVRRIDTKVDQDAWLDVEIATVDGERSIRVKTPHAIDLKGGGRMEIPAQERKLKRGLTLKREDVGTVWVSPALPVRFNHDDIPRDAQPNTNFLALELVSPPVEALGIPRMRIGASEIVGKSGKVVTPPDGPLRLHFKVHQKSMTYVGERYYYAIRPK